MPVRENSILGRCGSHIWGDSTITVLNGLPEKTFFGIFLNAKDILETQVGAVDRTEISGIEGAVVELLGSSAIHRSYAREIGENFARFDQNQAHSSRTDCSR